MAHPYASNFAGFPEQGFKGKGKGHDTSQDWNCKSCGDQNFAKRVACRSCNTPNPDAKMPEIGEMGFKTVMCQFFMADRCTKGAYCTFAHGEEELVLGKQMMEAQAEAAPGPALHEAPLEVQQFLAGFTIKPLPLKQFLNMTSGQQNLVIQQGLLNDARDPTAMLISRMVKVKKMTTMHNKGINPLASIGRNPMASFAQVQAPPSGAEYQVIFQPGPLGVGANWTTGRVDKVVTGGQGLANGVAVGDWFTKVNGTAYTEQMLDAARATGQPFTVSLIRPQENALPQTTGLQNAVPQELGQFAAGLGMEWAFGGAQS
eukprot:TRINITY_DN2290_c0_g3_i1.p1 TRINITY_DN2290_c0_g3~~TRINITY_DN2290_c0_g3_i1.p1  ORF type:complete len:316 (-),score=48.95 TRINITY_DN2290_c0_g3_i1:207-1154(-)